MMHREYLGLRVVMESGIENRLENQVETLVCVCVWMGAIGTVTYVIAINSLFN